MSRKKLSILSIVLVLLQVLFSLFMIFVGYTLMGCPAPILARIVPSYCMVYSSMEYRLLFLMILIILVLALPSYILLLYGLAKTVTKDLYRRLALGVTVLHFALLFLIPWSLIDGGLLPNVVNKAFLLVYPIILPLVFLVLSIIKAIKREYVYLLLLLNFLIAWVAGSAVMYELMWATGLN